VQQSHHESLENTGGKEMNIWHHQFYRFYVKQNDFEMELITTFFSCLVSTQVSILCTLE